MVSQLRCLTIGTKTPVSSGVAPQRADSTRYRASVVDPARMYELRSVLTAILPLQTMRWVPHYPHFSSLLFSTKIDGSILICAKLISNFADAKHYRGQYRPAVHSRFLHVSTASPTPHYALVGLILRRYFAVFRAEKCVLKNLSCRQKPPSN